jgi:hemolysin III
MHDPSLRVTRWRGRVHQAALIVAFPAAYFLIRAARHAELRRTSATWSAVVFSVSVIGLFATSSLYNRCLSTSRLRPWMRWIDHAMIYVLIAGSYTPICVLVAPKPWGPIAISLIWIAALSGMLVKLTSLRRFSKLGSAWYLVMGWAAVLILPILVPRMSTSALALLVGGGLCYTIGAMVVRFRWPIPSVELFGYHEVWHVFVVAGCACHYAMQWLTITGSHFR